MGQDAAPPTAPVVRPGWTLAGRVAFRFALAYLVLYILPFPLPQAVGLASSVQELVAGPSPPAGPSVLGKWVLGPYAQAWDAAVLWVGKTVFGVEITYRPRGSGDTTWNYFQVFAFAVLAAAVALSWSVAAWGRARLGWRPRAAYPRLHEWLRVYVRFYLAYQMVVYGAMKVIKLQFAFPGPDALLYTYGESSPMKLLWTFMGASDGYTWFTGAGELLAGLLLCTRRTALLGALVTFEVMVHVAALNFCYDVPVKLFSSHLVLMSLFLIAPDLPWLTRALVLGRPTVPRVYGPLVGRPWADWTLLGVRTVVVAAFVGVTFHDNHDASRRYGRLAPEPPLAGLWEVEEFAVDGAVRPPLTTDPDRWQRLTVRKGASFQKGVAAKPSLVATNMPGRAVLSGELTVDPDAGTLTLTRPGGTPGGPPPAPQVLKYSVPEPGVLVVEGSIAYGPLTGLPAAPRRVTARLRHYGPDKFLLSSRGFRWVNETPYNYFGPRADPPPTIPRRPSGRRGSQAPSRAGQADCWRPGPPDLLSGGGHEAGRLGMAVKEQAVPVQDSELVSQRDDRLYRPLDWRHPDLFDGLVPPEWV